MSAPAAAPASPMPLEAGLQADGGGVCSGAIALKAVPARLLRRSVLELQGWTYF